MGYNSGPRAKVWPFDFEEHNARFKRFAAASGVDKLTPHPYSVRRGGERRRSPRPTRHAGHSGQRPLAIGVVSEAVRKARPSGQGGRQTPRSHSQVRRHGAEAIGSLTGATVDRSTTPVHAAATPTPKHTHISGDTFEKGPALKRADVRLFLRGELKRLQKKTVGSDSFLGAFLG